MKYIRFLSALIIIIIILCSYEAYLKPTAPDSAVAALDTVSVNISMDADLSTDYINAVNDALYLMPGDVIKTFTEDNWKIIISRNIDLTDTEYEGMDNPATAGLINFTTKTISVSPIMDDTLMSAEIVKKQLIHELGHYVDSLYNISDNTDFIKIYNDNKDYIDFDLAGLDKTEENSVDIEYATSNVYEFFVSTFKCYVLNKDYLLNNYPEIYQFYVNNM